MCAAGDPMGLHVASHSGLERGIYVGAYNMKKIRLSGRTSALSKTELSARKRKMEQKSAL